LSGGSRAMVLEFFRFILTLGSVVKVALAWEQADPGVGNFHGTDWESLMRLYTLYSKKCKAENSNSLTSLWFIIGLA
jgi:hypothetical protein